MEVNLQTLSRTYTLILILVLSHSRAKFSEDAKFQLCLYNKQTDRLRGFGVTPFDDYYEACRRVCSLAVTKNSLV